MNRFNHQAPLNYDLSETEFTQIANTLRFLSIDAVQKANSGHPGAPMGLADVATAIWAQGLKFDPNNSAWSRRDRFVLSCGHASMLLYSLLYLFNEGSLSLKDLKDFRQLDSLTPGHPERGHTAGVEMTTGPLGQGCATSVGMAAAAARFEEAICQAGGGSLHPWSDQKTVVLCSDGDLMEGISYEAASLAGHWRLEDLIWFYDHNSISIDGTTSLSFTENVGARFIAMGWRVLKVDGHDAQKLGEVVQTAWQANGQPTLVICKTHIGFGSPNKVDSSSSHGSPLGDEEINLTRDALNWKNEPFKVPAKVTGLLKKIKAQRSAMVQDWEGYCQAWSQAHPEAAELAQVLLNEDYTDFNGLFESLLKVTPSSGATRKLSNQALIEAFNQLPKLMGGSADLSGSNGLSFKEKSFGSSWANSRLKYDGRIMHFGVREHAMAAITNGLTVHGTARAFNGTFLVFSDYLKPALRLAALSKIPSMFVLSHDSIFLGEDGPTHQPVEHAWAIRLIPDVLDFRPADGMEVAMSWAFALSEKERPSTLMLTRQTLPALERAEDFDPMQIAKGAYLLCELYPELDSELDESELGEPELDEKQLESIESVDESLSDEETHAIEEMVDELDKVLNTVTLVGTGSEVALCVEVAKALCEQGIRSRVISMPSVKLFLEQDVSERRALLGEGLTVTVEAGSTLPWAGVVGMDALHIGIDHFGASAPINDLINKFGFSSEQILTKILARLENA